jgi:predicted nucleotidyltransferase
MTQADLPADPSPPSLPPLVRRTLDRLVRAFAPERVLLFGSHAKGTARNNSDMDLLVIAHFEGDLTRHQRRAKQLAADCFPPVDIVIATPAEVAGAASAKSPFLLSILGSGKTVYPKEGSRQSPGGP